MTRFDYLQSQEIATGDYPFYALIMAAMRQADSVDTKMLQGCWPEVWNELQERYNAPGGYLDTEEMEEGIHQDP